MSQLTSLLAQPFLVMGASISLAQIITLTPLIALLFSYQYLSHKWQIALISISTFSALCTGFIEFSAVVIVGVSVAIIAYLNRCQQDKTTDLPIKIRYFNWLNNTIIFLLSVALLLHLVPGFNNLLIIEPIKLSENAVEYRQFLNFDKAILAAILLLLVVPKNNALNRQPLWRSVLVFIVVSAVCIGIALKSELVAVDVKLIALFIPWALVNLTITCVAEEAFFRGFLQIQFASFFARFSTSSRSRYATSYANSLAILATSVIFALAHFPAGGVYMLLAGLLSVSYGVAYYLTKNIYLPILMHFSFNSVHFILLTYPYLAS